MEPSNASILYFEMILSLLMVRVTADRVKYRMISSVGIEFNPRCYADGLAGFNLKRDAKYKTQERK